ncbi:MAG: hypothetical protein JHC37_00130 [Campylobacteraceae bacterium]|jgi:hypothetical protein|nr:hypothetical protein [Campylobacteraceae bacterium]
MALYIALEYEISATQDKTKKAMIDRKFLSADAVRLKSNYDMLKEELAFAIEIKTSNTLLKDNIANIFAIIPDQVMLTKIEVSSNCLVLYGNTPSKEIYNLHLAPALKSIFTTSETSFSRSGNGMKFISINKLEKEEGKEEAAHAR